MLPQYSIRRITERDLDRILEVEAESFGKEAYDRKLFAEYLHKCGDLFLGAWKAKKLCGYMLTRKRVEGRAELVSVAVDPRFRGKGAAGALMRSTLRRLRWRGVHKFGLMVKWNNEPARVFYQKYGFRTVRRVPRYYEDGHDALLMTRDL